MVDSKEKFFLDFFFVFIEKWMEKVIVDLKGVDFEKKFVWKINEGFKVKFFYWMEDLEGFKIIDVFFGEFFYLRGMKKNSNEWLVCQEIKVEFLKEVNVKVLDILNKGIDFFFFYVKVKEFNVEYIEILLNDICVECVELNFFICQGYVVEFVDLLVVYFQKKDYDLMKL